STRLGTSAENTFYPKAVRRIQAPALRTLVLCTYSSDKNSSSPMRANRSFEPHLAIKAVALLPGGEWQPQAPGWSCLCVTTGIVYWLNPRMNQELITGSVLICAERAQGLLRASQLGGASMHYFRLSPERLTGLMTLG